MVSLNLRADLHAGRIRLPPGRQPTLPGGQPGKMYKTNSQSNKIFNGNESSIMSAFLIVINNLVIYNSMNFIVYYVFRVVLF